MSFRLKGVLKCRASFRSSSPSTTRSRRSRVPRDDPSRARQVTEDYEIIFVADPCTDRTVELIRDEHARDPRVKLLLFSRRFGQPAATIGGMTHARGQAVVVIDCDLQDPPGLIPEMVRLWRAGNKVVIPQRTSREGETLIKRIISYVGYWVINRIAIVPIPRNTGDFRLLDRRVVEEIVKLPESHGFLRGLTSVVGFKTVLVPFNRDARAARQGEIQPAHRQPQDRLQRHRRVLRLAPPPHGRGRNLDGRRSRCSPFRWSRSSRRTASTASFRAWRRRAS